MNRELQDDEFPILVVDGVAREESGREKWYQDLLVSWIFQTWIRIHNSLDRRFLPFKMTAMEASVLLCCVEARQTTSAQLSIMLARDKSTMTYIIRRLEARRLVRREILQRDRRCNVINATGNGREIAKELTLVFDNARRALFEGIAESDVQRLGEMLPRLHKNATQMRIQQEKDT
jgi:DNA-binding MarR family transcriptional regulator